MHKQYLDTMAWMAKFGVPTFLITFTMNVHWPEVLHALQVGNFADLEQTSEFRPDVIMRVFRIKYRAFLTDILYHQALGKIAEYAAVMEFQKRGMPHVHLAVICAGEDRVVEPSKIDLVISAELPDPEKEPRLFDVVKGWQIHSPCDSPLPSGQPKNCHRPVPGRPRETQCRSGFLRSSVTPPSSRHEVRFCIVDATLACPLSLGAYASTIVGYHPITPSSLFGTIHTLMYRLATVEK